MGWDPAKTGRDPFLILSTQGGMRADDGTPVALGYHTGHWEVGLLVREAALELDRLGGLPFAAHVSDPCDGRTQGTTGMFDSLPYRNDAALVLRRLVRSLPTRRGVIAVGTCDKGLPAMTMALASFGELAGAVIPGGVTLPPRRGRGRRRRPDARRPLRPRARVARGGGRPRLPRVRQPRRRLPVPRHRRDCPGGRGGLRADRAARRAGTVGAADLAGRRPAHRAGSARAMARGPHARRRPHARTRSRTPCSRTPHSAARRTS